MTQANWNFNGNITTTNSAKSSDYSAYLAGSANGLAGTANGGQASLWQGTLNSSLSTPLAVGGDYCRSMNLSGNVGANSGPLHWCGMNLLRESAGGGTYPVTDPPTPTTLWAYSLRAFLRIGCLPNQQDNGTPGDSGCGTFVGVQGKSVGGSSEFNGNADTRTMFAQAGLGSGYGLLLSSANHITLDASYIGNEDVIGYGSPGGNDIRLVLTAAMEDNGVTTGCSNATPANHSVTLCTAPGGGYQNNIWYHVRLDIIGGESGDTIKAYTAPVTDVIGSETWTLVGTKIINTADPFYTDWTNTSADQIGWIWGAKTDISRVTQRMSDAYIDRFQFFTKDIA